MSFFVMTIATKRVLHYLIGVCSTVCWSCCLIPRSSLLFSSLHVKYDYFPSKYGSVLVKSSVRDIWSHQQVGANSWFHQQILVGNSCFHQQMPCGRQLISPTHPPSGQLISPTHAPPETLDLTNTAPLETLDLTNHVKGSSSSVDKSPVGDSWFHQHVLPRRHLISPTRAPPETLDLTNHLKAITICFTSKDTKFKYHQTHFTRSLKIWTFCELWWIDEAKSKTVQVLTSSKTRAGVDFIPKTH